MADKKDKVAENIPGKFYVDHTCIDCNACRDLAPNFFKRFDDEKYSYVFNQPVTKEDIALCEEACEYCPASSIGNDG